LRDTPHWDRQPTIKPFFGLSFDDDEKTDGNQRGEDEEKSTPVYTRDAGETGDAWDAETLDEPIRIASKRRRRRSTTPM
jgi:hypothetical protein